MYVATSIEISHRENNFSYAAFSGCHSVGVNRKATACRAESGREPYDREGNLDAELFVSFSNFIKHFFIFVRKTC